MVSARNVLALMRREHLPYILSALMLLATVLVLAAPAILSSFGQNSQAITIKYATEKDKENAGNAGNEGNEEGVVNSPLKIAARIPWQTGTGDTMLSSVTVQLVDEAGNPAQYGESVPESLALKPTIDIQVWEYVGSMPSKPGTYHARVQWRRLYGDSWLEEQALKEPLLIAKAEPGEPLRSGYVFNYEYDLWMMSTDGSRQRRLTYFERPDEFGEDPSWSPDGSRIAYTYWPKTGRTEVPASDIWAINPDGTGATQLVGHGENESLYDPSWSPDGRYLYFTVESARFVEGVMAGVTRRIDRVELSTGVRSQWLLAAYMPAPTGEGEAMVYLEEVQTDFTRQRVAHTTSNEAEPSVIVPEDAFIATYGPRMSPDRKWVVFSASEGATGRNGGNMGRSNNNDKGTIGAAPSVSKEFDFLKWLFFEPAVASAHDVPWDIYMVPAQGGTPVRLTRLNDDQPHPIWLDNSTIAFMGIKGLYRLNINGQGSPAGEPVKLREGAQHAGVTWHGP